MTLAILTRLKRKLKIKITATKTSLNVGKTIAHLRAYLHEGGGPQVGEVTRGKLPHLTCKPDHIKMRVYMDRKVTPPKRVTSPMWGPPPPCKKALTKQYWTSILHKYLAAFNGNDKYCMGPWRMLVHVRSAFEKKRKRYHQSVLINEPSTKKHKNVSSTLKSRKKKNLGHYIF